MIVFATHDKPGLVLFASVFLIEFRPVPGQQLLKFDNRA
jgi:hypothetical protein